MTEWLSRYRPLRCGRPEWRRSAYAAVFSGAEGEAGGPLGNGIVYSGVPGSDSLTPGLTSFLALT